MAEPGDEKEGTIDEQSVALFGDYRCVFRAAADSLYIMMKNVKTKRSFHNTFSKSTLNEMELKQSIDRVVNLLKEAKSGTKSELTFKIAFGDADSDKKVQFDKLSNDWNNGSALFILVAIDNTYFAAEYVFKLLEQKRSEIDILRDIIDDLQQEIHQLKNTNMGVATWYTQKGGGSGNLTMDGYHLEPTLKGMITLSDNKQEIIIGISGLYKVSSQILFQNGAQGTNGHYLYMQVNEANIYANPTSQYGGFGYMEIIVNLKTNDKITFTASHLYPTGQAYNRFTVQKLHYDRNMTENDK
eukprot:991076_1